MTTTTAAKPSKALNISLWVVQILLALLFLNSGLAKLTKPTEELTKMGMTFVSVLGEGVTRFIGLSELAGALGLVLPSVTRIAPKLTPLAGAGLTTVMILAALYHITQGEVSPLLAINFVLGGLAAFVAWGRFRAAPIAPRSSGSGTASPVE